MTSGLGGLGLEGIVGIEDSDGEKAARPGVGNKGSISGEMVGEKYRGAPGNVVGAAEMVETCMLCREAEANDEQLHAIKAMNIAKNGQKEAINDGKISINCFMMNSHLIMNVSPRENCSKLESGETEEVHH